jgi:hypothetical protein
MPTMRLKIFIFSLKKLSDCPNLINNKNSQITKNICDFINVIKELLWVNLWLKHGTLIQSFQKILYFLFLYNNTNQVLYRILQCVGVRNMTY